MGVVPRSRCRAGAWAVAFVLAVMAIGLFREVRPACGAELRCVQGCVTSVWGTEIVVHGKTYDIAGIPIRDSNQKVVPLAEIVTGRKVDLYYRGDRLFLVLLYPKFIE